MSTYRDAPSRAPVTLAFADRLTIGKVAMAVVGLAFGFAPYLLETKTLDVDCRRIERTSGECTMVGRNVLGHTSEYRATIEDLATARAEDGDNTVGILVGAQSHSFGPSDSSLQKEKRALAVDLRTFALDTNRPTARFAVGNRWSPHGGTLVFAGFGLFFAALALRRGKLRVVLDPGQDRLTVKTTRFLVVPTTRTTALSAIEGPVAKAVDLGSGQWKVEVVGTRTSQMDESTANEAASAINDAVRTMREDHG